MQMSYYLENFFDFLYIFDDYDEDVFLLDLRRATILEDTFEQLADACDTDYKKPLRVKTTSQLKMFALLCTHCYINNILAYNKFCLLFIILSCRSCLMK